MDANFNSDYYVAIITVVPLLYITLFLQSAAIQDFSKKVGAVYARQVFILLLSIDDFIHGELKSEKRISFAKAFLFTIYVGGLAIYLTLATVLAGPLAAGYAI
jgi:hypothetical protein